jgi:carbonic anhydrase
MFISKAKTTKRMVIGAMFVAIAVSTILAQAYAADNRQPAIAPGEAFQRLKDGNDRYASGNSIRPDATAERRKETLLGGQHPFATVVSCSDSRVPVEILFDQGIGDLFVVRVAGNVCNGDEIATVEYGVEHLGTTALIVLGHTKCGAVTAVAQGAELHGNLRALVHNIYAAVDKAKESNSNLQGEALVAAAVEANVRQSIADLLKSSPAVRERVESGKLQIKGAIYDLGEGRVNWLKDDSERKQLPKDVEKTR